MILDFKKFINENTLAAALLPSVTKTSRIQVVERNKNPILIMLSDGTKLYLSWNEYRRLNEEPSVGKKITINFQRHPGVKTAENSKINYIQIH